MTSQSPASLWLLLDTCSSQGSVALVRGETTLFETVLPERMASAAVLPSVREALRTANVTLQDLTACGVVNGPGSFTGLRVGLSVAKGLAEAGGLPLVPVSRLAVLAQAAGLASGFAALYAGPGQVFVGAVEDGACIAERLMTASEFLNLARGREVVYSEAAVETMLQDAPVMGRHFVPTAKDALPLVKQGFLHGPRDLAQIDANYVRDEASIYARPQTR